MFRAVSDRIFGSQVYHFLVRQKCVDFMEKKKEEFEPFVCVSGMPWDHYIYEMRKINTWAGQVELQALSILYSINISVYNSTSEIPLVIDNGFKKKFIFCILWQSL